MKPNHEPDELSEVLEAGYAAPPLDAAFSDNLVCRMQAEVSLQTRLPRNRPARWAMVLCGVCVAASILAVICVLNPLGTQTARDEMAMQSVPGSRYELSSSPESMRTRSLETTSNPPSDAKVNDIMPLDVPLAKSRGSKDAPETLIQESLLESKSEFSSGVDKREESKVVNSKRILSESMAAAVMEEVEIVSKERAKALGLSITSQADGPEDVRVSLAFEKRGELKEYNRVELKQVNGNKLLLSVTLKEDESKPGRVIVGFVVARSNLDTVSLVIKAKDASGSRVRYVLPMKDLVTKPEGLTQP